MFKQKIKLASFFIVGLSLIAPLAVSAGCCQITITAGSGSGLTTTASYVATAVADQAACDKSTDDQKKQHPMDDVSGKFYVDQQVSGNNCVAPAPIFAGCCWLTITGGGVGGTGGISHQAKNTTDEAACMANQKNSAADIMVLGGSITAKYFAGSSANADGSSCVDANVKANNNNNSWLPKITNPFDNLQVKIPTLTGLSKPDCSAGAGGGTSCKIPWIAEYITALYKYGLGIGTMLAILSLMIGGVLWLISGGQQNLVKEAKAWIFASISGSVLLFGSYLLLETLNPNLVNLNAVDVTNVEAPTTLTGATTNPDNLSAGTIKQTRQMPSNISQISQNYDGFLRQAAQKYGLDCTQLKAQMLTESSGNPSYTDGLLQVTSGTAGSLGCGSNLRDPATGIDCGAHYMATMRQKACNGQSSSSVCNASSWDFQLAAYNAGPGANAISSRCNGGTAWQCLLNVTTPAMAANKQYGYDYVRAYVSITENFYNQLKSQGFGCN